MRRPPPWMGERHGVGGFAALRSAGLIAQSLIVESVAVWLPPVVDKTGLSAHSPLPTQDRARLVVETRRKLLGRLTDRAAAMGAVGLVAVTCRETVLPFEVNAVTPGHLVEIVLDAVPVLGVAPTLAPMFRTACSAVDVAKLHAAGMAPVDVHFAAVVQTRDQRHRASDVSTVGSTLNTEVPGPTDLIQRARRAAVDELTTQASQAGADGMLLHGSFDVRWPGSTYRLVQVVATGNGIRTSEQAHLSPTRSAWLQK